MVRTTTDGYLSLSDLIRECTSTCASNASNHVRNLALKGLLPQRDKVCVGQGNLSHVLTREEWDGIKHHLPQRLIARSSTPPNDLYVL